MAQEAFNLPQPELAPAPIEYANAGQLSTIYSQAQVLLEKAQNQQSELFHNSEVRYNTEDNTAFYTYKGFADRDFFPGMIIRPEGDVLYISALTKLFRANGDSGVVERKLLINEAGVCYGSEVSQYQVEKLNGYKYEEAPTEKHLRVPKDMADATQQLIDMIWDTPHKKQRSGILRRIIMS